MNTYVYSFIREDLPLEQKIVQLGHATWQIGCEYIGEKIIPNLIVLSAKNEADILDISKKLEMRGIKFHMFYEPDNLNDKPLGYSAIATEPIFTKENRNFFKRWKLYKTC